MRRDVALRHKINRAITFTQSNYDGTINLDQMADVACLSKFHFARSFQDYLHEAPYSFLHRTRLEQAARSLTHHPGKRITDIAFDCGFASPQAFSNAFRDRFKMSPRQYKHNRRLMSELSYRAQLLAESSSVRKRFEASSELLNQRVDIVRKPEMRIAYVRSIGPYFDVEGANLRASTTLADWAKRRGLWSPDATFLGVCPNAAALTPPNLCVYDVGIVVREDIVEDDTISIQTLPSGKYAALSVACSSLQLDSVWSWMVSTWLPASGETYELKNSYEVYVPGQHDIIKPEYGVEVCLRLV